jgi:hypothetical protein
VPPALLIIDRGRNPSRKWLGPGFLKVHSIIRKKPAPDANRRDDPGWVPISHKIMLEKRVGAR